MSVVKADRFTALKAKVKAEVSRRNKSGSVAAYGGAAYDYTVQPGAGKVLLAEHLDKLSVPLSAINADAVPGKTGARVVTEAELSAMETRVTAWSARSLTDTSGSDCKNGCTGACYTGCSGGCTGCGSGCPTGCSGCGSGCPTGCSSCGGACSTSCSGCSGCGSGCASGCSGCGSGCPSGCSGCGSGCPNGCYNDCSGYCLNTCLGCSGGCKYSCDAECAVVAKNYTYT